MYFDVIASSGIFWSPYNYNSFIPLSSLLLFPYSILHPSPPTFRNFYLHSPPSASPSLPIHTLPGEFAVMKSKPRLVAAYKKMYLF